MFIKFFGYYMLIEEMIFLLIFNFCFLIFKYFKHKYIINNVCIKMIKVVIYFIVSIKLIYCIASFILIDVDSKVNRI